MKSNRGMSMSKDEALKAFSQWYESCLENGISPEEIIAEMGGMALITDESLVERIQADGLIPTY
jgi:precorrin-6x reductase